VSVIPALETLAATPCTSLLHTDQNGLIEVSTDGSQTWVEVERKQDFRRTFPYAATKSPASSARTASKTFCGNPIPLSSMPEKRYQPPLNYGL